jgi:ribosomal protein S18 acetylase RimI-like enzyme
MTNKEISIRQAKESDLEKMAQIFIEDCKQPPHSEEWTPKLAYEEVKAYYDGTANHVAEVDNQIVGFISFETYEDFDGYSGYIVQFMVAPDFQRKGIGKRLIQSVEDYFIKKGIKRVYLEVDKDAKALDFYRNQGYKEAELISMKKEL